MTHMNKTKCKSITPPGQLQLLRPMRLVCLGKVVKSANGGVALLVTLLWCCVYVHSFISTECPMQVCV